MKASTHLACCNAVLLFLAALPLMAWAATDAPLPVPFHIHATVVMPDGKPAVGITVLYDRLNWTGRLTQTTQTATTDANGTFDITDSQGTAKPNVPIQYVLYIASPAGVAVSGPERKTPTITLQPFTRVRIHLVGEDGKPVANVKILPRYLFKDRDFASWFGTIADIWTGQTDADGDVTLSQLPQGYTMMLGVEDERYAEPDGQYRIVLAKAANTADQTIRLIVAGTITGTVHYSDPAGTPAVGVSVQAMPDQGGGGGGVQTDQDGRFRITRLRPGNYTLRPFVLGVDGLNWTAAAQPAVVTRGGTLSGINLTLIHGAVLTGTVMDKVSGKPVAGISVVATGPGNTQSFAQTDADGHYQVRVPGGAESVMVYGQGPNNTSPQPQNITIADGQTKTLDFQVIAPPVPLVVKGVVLGPSGKPVPGAEVLAIEGYGPEQKAVADAQGQFIFNDPGLTNTAQLFARFGSLATPTAVRAAEAITLHLVPNSLCRVEGIVHDEHGEPVASAKVTLTRWRDNRSGEEVGSAQTDAGGHYSFASTYSGVKYTVQAEKPGCAPADSAEMAATPGKALIMQALTLTHADSFVGGMVVDLHGKPVAGAKVTATHLLSVYGGTDGQGRFHITGLPAGEANIDVRTTDGRSGSGLAAVGTGVVTVKVMTPAEAEAEGRRFEAMLQNDPTNHGNGSNANALLASAEARAKASGKKVFLVFHASWCGPCFALRRFLDDPKVKPIFEVHFIVQDIDIWEHGDKHKAWENPGGVALYKKFSRIEGVPYFVVLNASGGKLGSSARNGENMGMPIEPDNVKYFFRLLKKASPSLSDSDFATFQAALQRSMAIF